MSDSIILKTVVRASLSFCFLAAFCSSVRFVLSTSTLHKFSVTFSSFLLKKHLNTNLFFLVFNRSRNFLFVLLATF